MSSCFVLRQSRAIHMMTDAMGYNPDGIIVANNMTKAVALPTMPVVITSLGPAEFNKQFARAIEERFTSFDDLAEFGEEWMMGTFEGLAEALFDGDAMTIVYMIGWSQRDGQPRGLMVNYWTNQSSRCADLVRKHGEQALDGARRSEFQELAHGDIYGSPVYFDQFERCGFQLREADDYLPELDLLHLTMIARHVLNSDGSSRQGGKAVLSTVTATGITQRVVHHWKEDDDIVGQKLMPASFETVDWAKWRAACEQASQRPKSTNTVDFSGLSRLQRERMEKKARKGTLRTS